MKISQDMIDAGAKAYCANRFEHGDKAIVWNDAIEAALRAALRVRKARKKVKREKEKFEANENERVDRSLGNLLTPDANYTPKPLTGESCKGSLRHVLPLVDHLPVVDAFHVLVDAMCGHIDRALNQQSGKND